MYTLGFGAILLLVLVAPVSAVAQEVIHPPYLDDADAEAVKRLIDAGADVNSKHISGATALHHLVSVSAEMGISGQKIRAGKIYFAGQWGATGHKRVAEVLVSAGANVNSTDTLGQTPLHLAALTGHSEASRFLLAKGADVNAADTKGRTPLEIARWSMTDVAMKELAVATGQPANAKAIRRRAQVVIRMLQAYGAK